MPQDAVHRCRKVCSHLTGIGTASVTGVYTGKLKDGKESGYKAPLHGDALYPISDTQAAISNIFDFAPQRWRSCEGLPGVGR